MPYALMNGPKQLYIKFKVSNEDVVLERVMFETRIRYDVELGQESGPGLFRRLKLKQWQKRRENAVRQYRQLAIDPRTKNTLDVPHLSDWRPKPEPTVVQANCNAAGPVHPPILTDATTEEPEAKRLCRTLSDASEDSMNFNQGGASSAEPPPKRNLETAEGQLLSLVDANREGLLEFANNLRSHEYRHASMGVRATSAMLSSLKELKGQATKLKQHGCFQQIQLDIAAFNDLDKFLRAIREVGFNLKELRAPVSYTHLRAHET